MSTGNPYGDLVRRDEVGLEAVAEGRLGVRVQIRQGLIPRFQPLWRVVVAALPGTVLARLARDQRPEPHQIRQPTRPSPLDPLRHPADATSTNPYLNGIDPSLATNQTILPSGVGSTPHRSE